MNNRRLGRNLPFQNVNNPGMLREAPQALNRNGGFNLGFHEEEVEGGELALPAASRYSRSWLYRLHPRTDVEQGLRAIFNSAILRILRNHAVGRFRITYRDRVSLLVPNMRTSMLMREEIDEDVLFTQFYDTIMILFESNDELEAEELLILLDITAPRIAGGTRGNLTHPSPLSLNNSKGIFIIPVNVNLMCGWICIAIHILKYNFNKADSLVPGICEVLKHRLTPHQQRSWKNWEKLINDDNTAMKELAKYIMLFFNTESAFDLQDSPNLIVECLPTLQIVILDTRGTPINIVRGTDWDSTNASNNAQSIYMIYDIGASHMHYLEDPKLFFGSDKIPRNYKWCNVCFKLFENRVFCRHTCSTLTCDRCCTYFQSLDTLSAHKKADLEIQMSTNELLHENSDELVCPRCSKECYNPTCLGYHIAKCSKYRQKKVQCQMCSLMVWAHSNHNCDPDKVIECENCSCKMTRFEMTFHRCYIQVNI